MNHSISIDDLKIAFDGKVVYDPLPQQRKFHMSSAKYRLIGGAVGGGKTAALKAEAIMRSCKYQFPLTGAIFRRSFPELEATVIRGMLDMLPTWFYKYNQSSHTMTLKNGSIIEFCYAESDADVVRYQSREWDWLGLDEMTHFSEYQFSYLGSRVRTTKPINTKIFGGTNPGGRGHNWVKERFIAKACSNPAYNSNEYDFIPAGIRDNPYLMDNNPDYINNLEMLPELERKALLEGDWNLFAGMFFTEWDPTRHIVDDFDVPEDWRLILAWDDGTREWRSVHLYAVDNDQRVWCIWEYYQKEEDLSVAAEKIRKGLQDAGYWNRIYKLVVDPSMKRTDSQTGLSSTSVLEGMGFGFQIGEIELGNNDRVEGWRIMKSYLSHKPYEDPMMKYFRSCGNIIRTIPQLIYYQSRSGNVSKKEDLDCFIAGTKVKTLYGEKNIENIRVGDYVYTPIGYKGVIKDGISGISHGTSWIICSDGTRLEGTPDHKIFIQNKGLVELKSVVVGDILQEKNIYLWKQRKSGTKEYYIADIPHVDTIIRMVVILKMAIRRYIGRSISTILEKFQKVWQCITKMVIRIIMKSQILNSWIESFTANCISRKEKTYKKDLKHGEILKKENEFYQTMPEKCTREHRLYPVRANIVESLLRRKLSTKDTALKSVNILIGWIYKNLKSVPFVERCLSHLIKELEPVHIVAVGSCEEDKVVYNLTVEDAHLYYANGKLVTNTSQEDHCADENRYLLVSLDRLPDRFESSNSFEIAHRNYRPKSSY